MNYRHFDFPNSQAVRDLRVGGGAGSAGSYMMVMLVVSVAAMLFAAAAVAALSQARPGEALPPPSTVSRSAATDDAVLAPTNTDEAAVEVAWAEATEVAKRIAEGLEQFQSRDEQQLDAFKVGRLYRLTSHLSAPASGYPVHEALGLDLAELEAAYPAVAVPDVLIVVLPGGDWVVEVSVSVREAGGSYRLYHDGVEEFLRH